MNLVMHRNYQTNAPAKFYEYSDRIEMDNPGNLYGKVRPDNFPNENDYRNPVIAVAMKTLGYVNQFGRGIETVQEELEANKNGAADFKFNDITTFKVVVMNADPESGTGTTQEQHRNSTATTQEQHRNSTEILSVSERKILENISADPFITSDKLSEIVGITAGNIRVNISKLKAKGFLERIGGDRGGYWKIKQ